MPSMTAAWISFELQAPPFRRGSGISLVTLVGPPMALLLRFCFLGRLLTLQQRNQGSNHLLLFAFSKLVFFLLLRCQLSRPPYSGRSENSQKSKFAKFSCRA